MPYCGSAKSGDHFESVKKRVPTSPKNETDSSTSAKTIPIVIRIEISAARNNRPRMTSSPQRRRAAPRGIAPGAAPADRVPASTLMASTVPPGTSWLPPKGLVERGAGLAGLRLVHRDDARRLGDLGVAVDGEVHEALDLGALERLRGRVHEQRP